VTVEKLPDSIRNAYWFQAFNAVSWQIVLGSPLILFARELGAPAVVLGLLAGMAPLTSTLQLLVAPHAEHIGYRNLMVKGWTSRVVTLIFLTILPVAALWLPAPVIIGLVVLNLFVFTVLRGIATCAWLPWVTALVPRALRGYYLSRDRTYISLASVAALAISGLFLFNHQNLSAYAVVFGLSFAGGAVSLYFLNRIPEPTTATASAARRPAVPWLSLLRDAPYTRLMRLSAAVQVFVTSVGTFVIVFARAEVGLADGTILWLSAGAALAGIAGLLLLRNRVDRLGSRPFLSVAFLWWVAYYLLWWLMAAGIVGSPWLVAPLLLLLAGFFNSIYELAMTRLLMNTVGDRPATTQYFALYSVVVSVLAGLAPIFWGWLLDSLRGVQVTVGRVQLDSYGIFFGLQFLLLGVVLLALLAVKEPSATSTGALLYRALVVVPSQRIGLLNGRR
jgi:hypothetical protein